jgi:hypothetical protein
VRDDQRLRRVHDYLRENLANPVSLEELAAHASLSRFHRLRKSHALRIRIPPRRGLGTHRLPNANDTAERLDGALRSSSGIAAWQLSPDRRISVKSLDFTEIGPPYFTDEWLLYFTDT